MLLSFVSERYFVGAVMAVPRALSSAIPTCLTSVGVATLIVFLP